MENNDHNLPAPRLHLELGDWVMMRVGKDRDKLSPPMYVTGIFTNSVYLEIDSEQGDPFEEELADVVPVIITKEILDANKLSDWFSAYACGGEVVVISKGVIDGCNRQIPIKYVHELQHFMRIYGIGGQIIL